MGLTRYYTPTKVILGKGAENEVAKELLNIEAKKVLIHYGSSRIEKNGLLDKVCDLLKEKNIAYYTLSGVVANPQLSLVHKGVALCKKENIDTVLAIGGGSVIDSAKAISYGALYEKDVWDFFTQKAEPTKALKTCCILTLAAAGSEMSSSCVISSGKVKRGYGNELSRLKFSLMNPELTFSIPPYDTAAGIVDIMMHTLERYFTQGDSLSITDSLIFALLKSVMENGKIVMKDPTNYDARCALMWASSLSHNGLFEIGSTTRGDWASHQIEHELSGLYNVSHGAGLASIWPSWARYITKFDKTKMAKLGKALFNTEDSEETIKEFEAYFKSLNMPIKIKDFGIILSDEEILLMAESANYFGKRIIGGFVPLDNEAIVEILKQAR